MVKRSCLITTDIQSHSAALKVVVLLNEYPNWVIITCAILDVDPRYVRIYKISEK